MPYSVEGKLVVAISSRALLDFEDENRIFERDGEDAYIALQLARLDVPAREGVAFPLVKKLLAFNTPQAQRVEVVILSKNDPVSGLRVFRSAERAGLRLERGVFTRGANPYRYLDALKANLFLSANENDVMSALDSKVPASTRSRRRRRAATRAKCASLSTATRSCSPTRRSAYIRETAWMRLRAMRRRMRSSRCRRARSSRCSKRCSACRRPPAPTCRCVCAPRW
jgi:hypothetical protein